MNQIERIQNTPIIRLSINELRMLPEDDLNNALTALFHMAKEGSLAMMQHNPSGTTYEVAWDNTLGWKLSPICSCGNELRFVEAYEDYHDPNPRQLT